MAVTGVEEEVRAVLNQMIDAQNAGDGERLRPMLSNRPDAVFIGTDPDEWWTSKEVVDAIAGSPSGDVTVAVDDIGVHALGDVAWVEGHGRFKASDGNERPVRVTSVLVREDGQWKAAQLHASITVPNEQIFS
jgi:uncharacterized protein (TIGR02246 family)